MVNQLWKTARLPVPGSNRAHCPKDGSKTVWKVIAQYKFPRPDFVQRLPQPLWSAGSFPIQGDEYKTFESIPFGNPSPKHVCIAQPRCRNQEGLDRIRQAAPTNCV